MKFTMSRPAGLSALALTVALVLAGCSSGGGGGDESTGSGGGGGGEISVVMLPKNLGNAYFDTSTKGAKAATEEFGGKFSEVGHAFAVCVCA